MVPQELARLGAGASTKASVVGKKNP